MRSLSHNTQRAIVVVAAATATIYMSEYEQYVHFGLCRVVYCRCPLCLVVMMSNSILPFNFTVFLSLVDECPQNIMKHTTSKS